MPMPNLNEQYQSIMNDLGTNTPAQQSSGVSPLSYLGNFLSGGLGVLGSLGSSALNYLGTIQAQRQQRSMMQDQMQWQERMQDKMLDYQDPRNQAARLRAAGINPALGQGSTPIESMQAPTPPSPAAPAGVPQFSAAEGLGSSMSSAVSAFAGAKLNDKQRQNIDFNMSWSNVLNGLTARIDVKTADRLDKEIWSIVEKTKSDVAVNNSVIERNNVLNSINKKEVKVLVARAKAEIASVYGHLKLDSQKVAQDIATGKAQLVDFLSSSALKDTQRIGVQYLNEINDVCKTIMDKNKALYLVANGYAQIPLCLGVADDGTPTLKYLIQKATSETTSQGSSTSVGNQYYSTSRGENSSTTKSTSGQEEISVGKPMSKGQKVVKKSEAIMSRWHKVNSVSKMSTADLIYITQNPRYFQKGYVSWATEELKRRK